MRPPDPSVSWIEMCIRDSSVLGVEKIEQKDVDRRDRAVAEVEDARGFVREHQAHTGQSVDRPGREPDHDERKELVHSGAGFRSQRMGYSTAEVRFTGYRTSTVSEVVCLRLPLLAGVVPVVHQLGDPVLHTGREPAADVMRLPRGKGEWDRCV